MIGNRDLFYLSVWVLVGLVAFCTAKSNRWAGAGIPLAFFVNMALNHWFGAVVSFLPWYTPVGGFRVVEEGFEISTLGLIGFAIGCFAIAPWLTRVHVEADRPHVPLPSRHVFHVFMTVGIACYLGMALGLGAIPSATAVLYTGSNLVLVSICIGLWHSRLEGDRGRFVLLLASAALLPLFTIVTQGFLGYGVSYAMVIVCFVVAATRLRWRWVVVGLALGFAALSFFVTYMRYRGEIRSAVWGGRDYGTRLESVQRIWQDFEWFDPYDKDHLLAIDWRLNLNWFVGAAASHLETTKSFANGETIWMAALALVPRAIWPSKPVEAGSMGLVSTYTGLKLDESTSWGMGLIFEFYINFRRYGVFVGLLLIGALVGVADRRAGAALRFGEPCDFAMWFMVGIVMLDVAGSLVEIMPGLVASVLIGLGLRRFVGPQSSGDTVVAMEEQPVEPANR
ncbi:MAG TPA: hypothetical protein VL486_04505 [Verrucomicrobiae bacterium]|nr:hypothetical protein [Verrucomicrobiae bacterium]